MKATVSPEGRARIDCWLAGEVDYWAMAGFFLPVWPGKVMKEVREPGEGGSPDQDQPPERSAIKGGWLKRIFGRTR